jgi:hypothetical protein
VSRFSRVAPFWGDFFCWGYYFNRVSVGYNFNGKMPI